MLHTLLSSSVVLQRVIFTLFLRGLRSRRNSGKTQQIVPHPRSEPKLKSLIDSEEWARQSPLPKLLTPPSADKKTSRTA